MAFIDLPPEVIAETFILAVQCPSAGRSPQSTLFALLRTSRFINNIAKSIPHLFTELSLSLTPWDWSLELDPNLSNTKSNFAFTRRINDFFARSGPCLPLRLSVDGSFIESSLDFGPEALLAFVIRGQFQERWQELHLSGMPNHDTLKTTFHYLHTLTWPSLKSLRLEVIQEDASLTPAGDGDHSFPGHIGGGLMIDAPKLNHLAVNLRTVVNFVALSSSSNGSGPWHTMQSLEMDTYTTSYEMLIILKSMPNLRECDVRLHGDEVDATTHPSDLGERITLDHLLVLKFRTAPNLDILSCLHAPALRDLSIEMMHDTDDHHLLPMDSSMVTLGAFIERSCSQTLATLKLARCPVSDVALERILLYTPLLRELKVWWGLTGSVLDALTHVMVDGIITSTWQCNAGAICTGGQECYGTHTHLAVPILVPKLEALEILVSPTVAASLLYEHSYYMLRARRCAYASQFVLGHSLASHTSWLDSLVMCIGSPDDNKYGKPDFIEADGRERLNSVIMSVDL